MNRRLRFRLQSRRRRAIVGHGVVSTGAPTPALIWVSPPGDYAIVNSNHIPDGTVGDFSMIEACVVLALAKQRDKVELIRDGGDPYRDMGAAIHELSPEQRKAFLAAIKEELTKEQDGWRA